MKCASLQWDVQRGAWAANLAAAEAALGAALEGHARLVVLPELWATSFPGPETSGDGELLTAAARALDWACSMSERFSVVVAGSYLVSAAGVGRRFFNRLVIFDGGLEVLQYDKRHLFQPTAEHEAFAAGRALPPVVESSVGRLGGIVCYDLRFGELFTHLLEAGVEVVVCPAQWPVSRAAHWRALVMGRAVETQATFVAANRLGVEVVGQRGRELEFPGNSLIVDGGAQILGEGMGLPGAVLGEFDREAGRQLRVRVPVLKSRARRGELRDAMDEAQPRPSDRRPRSNQ